MKKAILKKVLANVITALSSVRLTPLIALMLLCSNRHMVWADLDRWAPIYRLRPGQPRNSMERIILFANLMTWMPQYRNVFYLRTRMPGKLLSILCRPMSSLHLGGSPTNIGPGLLILHGDGTFVSADEIGENCTIFQQVSIGYINKDRPTSIGNNVTVCAGAKVLGRVRVGDNVTIGANSVVISDVPPNVTVMGVPAVVVWSAERRQPMNKSDHERPKGGTRPRAPTVRKKRPCTHLVAPRDRRLRI
jgi:serine O-acetyltransferase